MTGENVDKYFFFKIMSPFPEKKKKTTCHNKKYQPSYVIYQNPYPIKNQEF